LEKARDARFQTVVELARALAPFGPHESNAAVERIANALGAGAAPGDDASEDEETRIDGRFASPATNARPKLPRAPARDARPPIRRRAPREAAAKSTWTILLAIAFTAIAISVFVLSVHSRARKAPAAVPYSLPAANEGPRPAPHLFADTASSVITSAELPV